MDLDELIQISEDKAHKTQDLWDGQDEEKEIEKQIESLRLRISSQNKSDLQLASLQELSHMAQQYPEKISELFQVYIQIITQQVATAQADQVYNIFIKICTLPGETAQKLLDKVMQVDSFVQFLMEHIKIYKGEAGLEFFLFILTNEYSRNTIYQILQNSDNQPEYFTEQSQFVRSLLQINTENSQKLLNLILFDVYTTEQIVRLYNDKQNLLSVLIQTVQQDKLLSSASTHACNLLVKLITNDKTSKDTYTQCIFFIQELVKMFQGIAYQVLQNSRTEITLQCLLSIIKLLHIVLIKSDANVKNFYSQGKIFDYCAMIVSICPTGADCSQQQSNIIYQIVACSIQILQNLIIGNEQVLLKLAVCYLQKQQIQPQPNVEPQQIQLADYLLQISFSNEIQHDVRKYAIDLFKSLIQNQDIATSVTAGLSKPVRAACRGTVIDGFKLIAKAFLSGTQLGVNQKQNQKEQEQIDPVILQYIQQSQQQVRQQLLKLPVPKYEMSFNICKQIMDQVVSQAENKDEEQLLKLLQSLLQTKESCLHFLGSVLDENDLNKVKSQNNIFKAENVAYILFKSLSDGKQRNNLILSILSQSALNLDNDLLFQLIIQNFDSAISDVFKQVNLLCAIYSEEKEAVSATFSAFPAQLVVPATKNCEKFSLEFLKQIEAECREQCVKERLESILTRVTAQANSQTNSQAGQMSQGNLQNNSQLLKDFVPRAEYNQLYMKYQHLQQVVEQQKKQIESLNLQVLNYNAQGLNNTQQLTKSEQLNSSAYSQSYQKRRQRQSGQQEQIQEFFIPQTQSETQNITSIIPDAASNVIGIQNNAINSSQNEVDQTTTDLVVEQAQNVDTE